MPPITIWAIRRLPSRDGWPLFQRFNVLLMLSRIGSHGVASFVSLPIQAPKDLIGWPSGATLMEFSRGVSSGLSFLVVITRSWHHSFSIFSRSEYLSFLFRYIVVSSAYRFILTRVHASGSMARSKTTLVWVFEYRALTVFMNIFGRLKRNEGAILFWDVSVFNHHFCETDGVKYWSIRVCSPCLVALWVYSWRFRFVFYSVLLYIVYD